MIDLLILGGAYLYTKFHDSVKGKPSPDWTPEDVRSKLLELARITNDEVDKTNNAVDRMGHLVQQHKEQLVKIQAELNGLVPVNVNSQLECIYKWMADHVSSEELALKDLAKKQFNWNVGLSIALGLSWLLVIYLMAK